MIIAHNHVLWLWLRGEIEDPDEAIETALSSALRADTSPCAESTTVVIRTSGGDVEQVVREVRAALTNR